MIIDGLMLFTGTSNGASGGITSSSYADAPTSGTQVASNIIDLGSSVFQAPSSASGGGARDIGIGDKPSLKLSAIVTTAFASGTNLSLDFSGAPDNGSGSAGSYTVMWQSPAVVVEANLIAGAQLANVDIPRVVWEQVLPRFLRLRFISAGTHTAGAVEAWVALDLDQQTISSAGNQSGYPAGVTVAN